jgi:hypothetical protein
VQAAAKFVNSKAGGGGIGGRKLIVDFIDSRLNPTETRNALITACSQDFALVGTAAVFLTNFDDAVNCTDGAGATTGLPDFPGVAFPIEACTPISFPLGPPSIKCDTVGKTPQTYQVNQGAFTHLMRKHPQGLHGAMIFANTTKETTTTGHVLIQGALHAGVKADQTTGISAIAQQTAYTPVVQQMKQDGSNFAYLVSNSSSQVELMSEAQLQGLTDPNFTWVCTTSCYDKTVTSKADATNNVYVQMNFLPFEEARTNSTLANFLKYVGPEKANGFAVYGWASTLAFAQAAKAAVAKTGPAKLTRAALLNGAKSSLTAFDAGGMTAKTDIAHKVQSPCTVLVQLRQSKWVRVFPTKKGTFDCTQSNHLEFKADLANGG